jgi:hypothetical protein
MPINRQQWLFGSLMIIGLIATWYFNIQFALSGDLSIQAFMQGLNTPAAATLTADAVVGTTVFLVWMIPEARRLGMANWWIYPLITLCIAFAFGFPLFMYVREFYLAKANQPTNFTDEAKKTPQ